MGRWNTVNKYLDLDRWHRVDVNLDGSDKSFGSRVERVAMGRRWNRYLFVTERSHVDRCVP